MPRQASAPKQAAPVELTIATMGGVDPAREIAERLEAHARAARGAFSDNTLRALAADSCVFAAWCTGKGLPSLPASPETVAGFIDAMAETKARATIERYRSSIAAMHRAASLLNPCADEIVRLALRRLSRTKGRRQRQAEPLNRSAIARMIGVEAAPRLHHRVTKGESGTPLIFKSNAAIVALANDTLLRRSRIVTLHAEDLERAPDGFATVLVRRSETDQEGGGEVKYLALDTVALLSTWLAAAVVSGPMFRPLTKGGRIGSGALGAPKVARVFRKQAAAAGLRMARPPSSHSIRLGATQDMFAAGLELLEVMQAGSWKTPAMPARYGERLRVQRRAARKLAALQDRT